MFSPDLLRHVRTVICDNLFCVNTICDGFMQCLLSLARTHFEHVHTIPAAEVTLTPLVRKLCAQNRCGNYGKNWTCPPAVPSLEFFQSRLAGFTTLILVYHVYALKSSCDWHGTLVGIVDFNRRLRLLKQALETGRPDSDFLLLGAGACPICDPCACATGEACRNPDEAIVSLEAAGIDVLNLMKANGLAVYHGKNSITYIGGVFCNGAL